MTEEIPQLKEGLADIKDLSFTDIFILQYLQRFQGPIVRIVLMETLNSFMQGEEMSPSSFYNRLKRLKRKGFISEEDERSRGQLINITPLALQALERISQISMMGSINFHEHTNKIIPKIIADLPELGEPSEKLLIINLEEGLDMETLQLITQFAHTTYIAADDITYDRYLGRGLPEKIQQSTLEGQTIREPGNWFDRVLIIGLECNPQQHDSRSWMSEAYRLLKSDGLLVVSSLAEFPETDHFVVNHLIDDISQNQFLKLSNEEELIKELEEVQFSDVTVKNYHGQLLVWGRKS